MDMLMIGVTFAAVVMLVLWLKTRSDDRTINRALLHLHAEAMDKLSPQSMDQLDAQLAELGMLAQQHASRGISEKQAQRMSKRAAIQTIASSLEIEKMFDGPIRFNK